MKKIFYIGSLAMAMLTVMPSCGGDNSGSASGETQTEEKKSELVAQEVVVDASSESEGTYADYVHLKEGKYTVNFTPSEYLDNKYDAKVMVTVVAEVLPEFNDTLYLSNEKFSLVFTDENGAPLVGELSNSDLSTLLKNGGTSTIEFSASWMEAPEAEKLIEKAKGIKLNVSGDLKSKNSSSAASPYVIEVEEDDYTYGYDDEEEVETSSASSSSDIDEFLDEYERYVDKAISLYKKAAAGDMSAMAEYSSFYDEAVELSNKLDNVKSDMSAAQLKRFNQITTKQVNSLI